MLFKGFDKGVPTRMTWRFLLALPLIIVGGAFMLVALIILGEFTWRDFLDYR